MALTQLFRVATEFKFEVGSAILGMEGLQKRVDGFSSSADSALISFQRFGFGVGATLGLGPGSILGLLTKSVQASERFKDSQIKISQVIQANRENFIGPIGTFNERMLVAENILKRVGREANKFSLPEKPLKDLTALLGAQLAGKGLLGKDFEKAIILSRDFLKATPLLGVDASLATGQLQDLISGNAVKGRLFERLTAETTAFQPFQAGGTKAFNALPAAKRLELLTKALQQFTSAEDEVRARTKTLTSAMTRLKNIIGGLNGVIVPLGKVLVTPIVDLIVNIADTFDKELRVVFKNLALIVGPLVSDLRGLVINLLQLKSVMADVSSASTALAFIGIGIFLIKFAILRTILLAVGINVLAIAGGLIKFAFGLGLIGGAFRILFFAVRVLFIPLAAVVALFQIISRAIAIARVKDIEALPLILEKISALGLRLSRAFALLTFPFRVVIDAVADFISPIFRVTTALRIVEPVAEGFVTIIEKIGKVVILATAGLQGLFFAIFQLIDNLVSGKFANLTGGVSDAFSAGVQGILEQNLQNLGIEQNATVSQVTNINGGIKIVNQFKENLQPDRIAFALRDQLQKTARNPTQARGRSFAREGGF